MGHGIGISIPMIIRSTGNTAVSARELKGVKYYTPKTRAGANIKKVLDQLQ